MGSNEIENFKRIIYRRLGICLSAIVVCLFLSEKTFASSTDAEFIGV